VKGIEQNRVRP